MPTNPPILKSIDVTASHVSVLSISASSIELESQASHFPSGDPQYRDISSLVLLQKVRDKLKESGWQIGNIDATIVAERPKLGDFMGEMCHRLSQTLDISLGQVNVKASTTERLGFVGREEGMAAYAVVLIEGTE